MRHVRPLPRTRGPAASSRSTAVLFTALAFIVPAVASGEETPAGGATSTSTTTISGVSTKETTLQRIQKMVAKINAEASTPEGEAAVLARLSKQLAVSPDSLEAQHGDWGLGYGELAMVYGFSRAGKKRVPPIEVVEMRRSGRDWESIAKELGVKVDTVASKMKKNAGTKPAPEPR